MVPSIVASHRGFIPAYFQFTRELIMLKKLIIAICGFVPLIAVADAEYFLGPNITVINNTRQGCDINKVPSCNNERYSEELRESGVELYVSYSIKYCYQANIPSCESGTLAAYVDQQLDLSWSDISGYDWAFSAAVGDRHSETFADINCQYEAIKEQVDKLLNKQNAQPVFIRVDFAESVFPGFVSISCTVSES
jgi:hypothetical protein